MYDGIGLLRYTCSLQESAFVEAIVGGSLKTRPRVRTRGSNGCLTSHGAFDHHLPCGGAVWDCDRVGVLFNLTIFHLENYLANVEEKDGSEIVHHRHVSPSILTRGHSV